MNVARLSAALAKKPVFFLDWNESSLKQSLWCCWGAASARPAHPPEEEERKKYAVATYGKGDARKEEKGNQNIRKKRPALYLKKYKDM